MSDLPPSELESTLLSWLQMKGSEGYALLKQEKAWEEMPLAMDYLEGRQTPVRSKAISSTSDNRLRKIALEIVSSMTDVRQIWNYQTYVEEYKKQADILNKLARAWWKNVAADRKLQSTLLFATAGGSGYAALTWNEKLPGGGDFQVVPYDPRNVIPIDPVYSDSVQDWRGVILRERIPLSTLKALYPEKAARLHTSINTWFGPLTRNRGKITILNSPAWVDALMGGEKASNVPQAVDLMRIFLKDERVNTGAEPIVMGDPDKNWSYTVYPIGWPKPDGTRITPDEAKLYPRGRFIVCTPECIIEDGPNPYWHGMFPIVRFTLDTLPWTLLGSSIIGDLIPLQNALNEGLRGMEDGMGQWIRRGVIADKNAISQSNLAKIDTRKAGLQAHINPTAGEGFKVIDGPNLPSWYLEALQYYRNEMDELSGVRGLQQLAQQKTMPSGDALDKFMEALSPLLRIRARAIEVALGEMAELLKVGFFQFYDVSRRVEILGVDGYTLEDFDYDPGSLVPDSVEGATREERAQRHHKNFSFSVAPNSFLNVSHSTQKMMMLQLLRAGFVDPWTAMEAFDIHNPGKAPAETVIDRIVEAKRLGLLPGPPPEVVAAQTQMAVLQAAMAMAQAGMMQNTQGNPNAPPPPQGGGGGGSGGNPQTGVGPQGGRPPSGEEPPRFVQKDGGSRVAVSESGS